MSNDASSDRRRVFRAFLVAPLTAPAAYATALVIVELFQSLRHEIGLPRVSGLVSIIGLVAFVGVPIAYGCAVGGGLPIYLLLRRAGIVSRLSLLIVGTAIGVVVAIVLAPQVRGEMISIPFPLWGGALLGLLTGEVFWRLLPADRSSATLSERAAPNILSR